ncbi:hypothetical protein ABV606_09315 [Ruicaihuangia caeni]
MKIMLALRETEMSVNHLADIVDEPPRTVARRLARRARQGSSSPAANG